MKKKQIKPAYDRKAVGNRVRQRREELGWSRSFVSERIGIVDKYYADIERGTCGMSLETLIGISTLYGMGMDDLIYGDEKSGALQKDETLYRGLQELPEQAQDYCLKMLRLFMDGMKEAAGEGK